MRKHFERAGRLISYTEAGVREAAGPRGTLVLLHAFPLSSEMWEPQLHAPPDGWHVVAPDLPGFGASFPLPTTATIEDDARDVVALLDRLGRDRAVVAGLSMGGYVALAVLRLAPDRLAGLVLADTRADADTEEVRQSRRQMLATLEAAGTGAVIDGMLPRLLGRTSLDRRSDVVEQVRAIALRQSPDGVRAAIQRLMNRPDSSALLPSIACPTLVVAGAEDAISPPEVARQMQRRIPGAQLAILDAAGHLSNLEQPEAFSAALSRFLP